MAVTDDAISSYLKSLGVAEDEFIQDVQDLEASGLSREEVLAAIAALNVASYFIEDLGMSAAISTQMAFTEQLLDDLPFFGSVTESQLVAKRSINTLYKSRSSGQYHWNCDDKLSTASHLHHGQ